MANDMMSTLKGLLGDNADEKIQSVLAALQSNNQNSGAGSTAENISNEINNQIVTDKPSNNNTGNNGIGNLDYLMRIKGLIDEMSSSNDARSNLLLSLRPYMRSGRQKGIDNAVRMLNLSKFTGLFK